MIHVGPTGNVVRGDVTDVSPKYLERALKDYDPQLYLKWNPKKLGGYGVWEVRRKPENYSVIAELEDGKDVYRWFGYTELGLIHHVLDCPNLDYRVLTKVKEMDTWVKYNRGEGWANDVEYNEYKWREREISKEEQWRKQVMRENSTLASDLKNAILSGVKPGQIARNWK